MATNYLILYKVNTYITKNSFVSSLMFRFMNCKNLTTLKNFNFYRNGNRENLEYDTHYVAIAKIKQETQDNLKNIFNKNFFQIGEYLFYIEQSQENNKPVWNLTSLNCDVKNFEYNNYVKNRSYKIKKICKNYLPDDLVEMIINKLFW